MTISKPRSPLPRPPTGEGWGEGHQVSRRHLLQATSLAALSTLMGCGFKLRGAQAFAFKTVFMSGVDASPLLSELRRAMESGGEVKVVTDGKLLDTAQVVLDVVTDQREKTVVGVTSSGQVREFQLRLRFKFKLRSKEGKELIPETEILQQRDISFTESAALSKEAEEGLLYRNMQSDIVQQIQRRLAAVKTL
jgi:LPS-assembly lipoprotein